MFRYFLADPLIWTEEFIVTLFAWMLFIGLASGFRERMHLRIDALLILLPRGLGDRLLGPIWRPTYVLVVPMTVQVIGACVSAGATAGLHALGAARRSLRAQILASGAFVIGGVLGALAGGATGTLRGTAAAGLLGAVLWWWQLGVALRESDQIPALERSWFGHPAARHRQQRPGLYLHPRKEDPRPRRQLDPRFFSVPDCPQPPPQLQARLRQRRDFRQPGWQPEPWLIQSPDRRQARPRRVRPPD